MKIFTVELICEDYDPMFKSWFNVVAGNDRQSVYNHFYERWKDSFDLYDRRLNVEELESVIHYQDDVSYTVRIIPSNGVFLGS
jgi:hypothetical protein